MFNLRIGKGFELLIDWLTNHFEPFFDCINFILTKSIEFFEIILLFLPFWLVIIIFVFLCYKMAGKGIALFSLIGFFLIWNMGFWEQTMESLSLILVSAFLALALGIPLGILTAKNEKIEKATKPLLDFMQTMPAFVYLIPAVLFFQLGKVPGVVATVIFAMPPAVRLTNLGIRQVPQEIIESALSFGATNKQLLLKVQLPLAVPTIFTGINQSIMLSLSMVVIAAMIGAGGLGGEILKGITQLKIDVGFESGLSVVILAIFLDRLTQSFAMKKIKRRKNEYL